MSWWIVTSFKEIWYLSHGDKNQAAVSLWVTCANGKKCHDTMGVSVDLCVVFHTSIAYHFVWEGVARDEWRVCYVNTHDNPADILTKPSLSWDQRMKLIAKVLHHLSDYS